LKHRTISLASIILFFQQFISHACLLDVMHNPFVILVKMFVSSPLQTSLQWLFPSPIRKGKIVMEWTYSLPPQPLFEPESIHPHPHSHLWICHFNSQFTLLSLGEEWEEYYWYLSVCFLYLSSLSLRYCLYRNRLDAGSGIWHWESMLAPIR